MLKKFITGLLALTLMTGTAGTITSFADDTQTEDTNKSVVERVRGEKGDKGGLFKEGRISIFGEKNDNGDRKVKLDRDENARRGKMNREDLTDEERDAKRAEGQERREETLNTMYPEIVETHSTLKAEADTNKEELKAIKDQIDAIVGIDKEAIREEHKAFMESLKTKIDAEEITREEAKELFEDYRETQKSANEDLFKMSDENKAKLEEIKAQFDALREDKKNMGQELKDAVENNDSVAFQTAFDKVIDHLEISTSLQNQKIQVLTDVLSNLQ